MSVVILLIIASVSVAILFLAVFIWAVKSGQFDDTVSPGIRMLFDEKKPSNLSAPKAESMKTSGDNGEAKKRIDENPVD